MKPKQLKAEHFITISQLQEALKEAKASYGDALVATTYDGMIVPLKRQRWSLYKIQGQEETLNVLFISQS